MSKKCRIRVQPSLTNSSEAPSTHDSIASCPCVMLQQASRGETSQLTEKLTTIGPLQMQPIIDLPQTPLAVERITLPCTQQRVVVHIKSIGLYEGVVV